MDRFVQSTFIDSSDAELREKTKQWNARNVNLSAVEFKIFT